MLYYHHTETQKGIDMLVKTRNLTDIAIEWAVAKSEGYDVYIPAFADRPWLQIRTVNGVFPCPKWATDWLQAGIIIERERFIIEPWGLGWVASVSRCILHHGPTPMVAAMRCFVSSKFGDEVEIPNELLSA